MVSVYHLKYFFQIAPFSPAIQSPPIPLDVAGQPQPLDEFARLVFAPLPANRVGRKYESKLRAFKMRQIKIVRTFCSLAAIGGSIVIVSWVGLALLGF